MANRIDERLENTDTGADQGYDETWSVGEVVAGGSAIEPNFTVSSVTGAPDNWDLDCLQHIHVASNACYVGDVNVLVPDSNVCWTRLEYIWSAESLANGQFAELLSVLNTNGTVFCYRFFLNQTAAEGVHIACTDYRDTTGFTTKFFSNLAANTPTVIETLWDITADRMQVYLNGDHVLVDLVLSGGAEATPVDTILVGGLASGVSAAATTYSDNLIANDAASERVGIGRFFTGIQNINGQVGTKALSPARSMGDHLNGALQAA